MTVSLPYKILKSCTLDIPTFIVTCISTSIHTLFFGILIVFIEVFDVQLSPYLFLIPRKHDSEGIHGCRRSESIVLLSIRGSEGSDLSQKRAISANCGFSQASKMFNNFEIMNADYHDRSSMRGQVVQALRIFFKFVFFTNLENSIHGSQYS